MKEFNFLSKEELKQAVPSIFQTQPEGNVSSRYAFVPTNQIIDNLEKVGWLPTEAKQLNSHKRDPLFGKHRVRFAPENSSSIIKNVGDTGPQLVLVNSHNRSCSLIMELGLFRKVCSNGLIVADSSFSQIFKRHIDISFKYIQEIIAKAVKEFGDVYSRVEEYRNINLANAEKEAFAKNAVEMVWSGARFEPKQVLLARRPEDERDDLYTTFNTIQENIIKGGMTYATSKGIKKARAINGIDMDFNINKNLWVMMEYFRLHRRFK